MGYYSEVAIVIPQDEKDSFLAAMKEYDKRHKKSQDDSRFDALTAEEVYSWAEIRQHMHNNVDDEEYFVMHWPSVKWYDCDPSRKAAFSFFEYLDIEADIESDFIRVGEDAGDIETTFNLDSEIIMPYVEQTIELYERGGLEDWGSKDQYNKTEKGAAMVKFVSYDGKWPCLCSGTLKIEVDGKTYDLEDVMVSGGSCGFTDGYKESFIHKGPWSINTDTPDFPEELKPFVDEIEYVVNKNVEPGCCGGCL